jgi:hypothetical protein
MYLMEAAFIIESPLPNWGICRLSNFGLEIQATNHFLCARDHVIFIFFENKNANKGIEKSV